MAKSRGFTVPVGLLALAADPAAGDVVGASFFNTTESVVKVWNGSQWVASGATIEEVQISSGVAPPLFGVGNDLWIDPSGTSLPVGMNSIDDLSDVNTKTTPPTNGQTLVYNSGSGQWVPGTNIWFGTQTQYDAIGTKQPTVLYCITGP